MAEYVAGRRFPDQVPIRLDATPRVTPAVRLRLFGRMEALATDGRSILPRVRKTRALLALLAMAGGEPVTRLHITSLLWSTRDREQARGSLRQAVHELNELLQPLAPDLLIAERNHLQLRRDEVESDLRAVTRATAPQPQALELLRGGPLLEDLVGLDPAFDRWLQAERKKLTAGAALVAEAVLAARIAEEAPPPLVLAAAQGLLEIDALRESGWRATMSAYMAMGERASAIAAFERCGATLAELAQLSPSAETRALCDAIRADARTTSAPPGQAAAAVLPEAAPPAPPPAPLQSHGVRLGVMPFRVLGGPGDEGLSYGLADEITNALARFRWISLIASPSLAAIRPTQTETQLRALGLDFLLEGSLQRAGNRIRVTVRLLDMAPSHGPPPHGAPPHSTPDGRGAEATGAVIWARRFDHSDQDLFSLQDDVAAATVAQIDPELLLREAHRATARPPSDPTAYQLMLRAIPALYRMEQDAFRAAGKLLDEAIRVDPTYAPAFAWLAYWHLFLVGQGWASDAPSVMHKAGELANRAVALDPADARALTIAGHVRSFLDHQHADAIQMHERALVLNPNLPLAWAFSGLSYSYAGRHEEAIRRIGEARRLSPFDPHAFIFETAMMMPALMRGQYEQVVELGRRAVHLNPTLSSTYKGYLCALGHLGPSAEMLAIRTRLLQLEPGFCIRRALARTPLRGEADRALYAEGLRRAGLPENSTAPSSPSEHATPPDIGPGLALS
jgi:DNA-binding SARP family transcriptional activator/TolB-like protein